MASIEIEPLDSEQHREPSPENKDRDWTLIVRPRSGMLEFHLAEIWHYRELLFLFVWRDLVATYKQTVLGPIWYFVQPLLTTFTFVVVFGGIAGISTDGLPQILFYLAGLTIWTYFAECLTRTSDTFIANAGIFGKVYFPRLILPLSQIISNLAKFAIQFTLLLAILVIYIIRGADVHPRWLLAMAIVPGLVILMAAHALGTGIIFSALTTKYRDLRFLLSFAVQLAMYATPVIYPMSALPERYDWLIRANPLAYIVETFRNVFLGRGEFSVGGLGYSAGFAAVVLALGLIMFTRVERTFLDTV